MEEKVNNQQNSSSNKAIIIVLVLIILGLLGFMVYDKFLQKDTKPGTNTQEKDCNCPKCEECQKCEECPKCTNNSTTTTSNLGEKVTSIKKLSLSTSNQVIKIGEKSYKIRINDEGELIVDDNKALSVHGDSFSPFTVYLTDKFLFATIDGQYKETIYYALGENGKISINDNDSQMDNFRIVDGYLRADGGAVQSGGQEISWKEENLIIKFIDNKLVVTSYK